MIGCDELAAWWTSIHKLENPLRREMHILTLYSGLRPGSVTLIERSWIKLNERKISFPKLKSGRPFDLPLSLQMLACIERAQVQSDVMFPNPKWLFATRSTKDRKIIPVAVWREKSMPGKTGHILRHTHRTMAQRVDVNPINARLLLDHTVPGIDDRYVHSQGMFDALLRDQQNISDEMDRFLMPTSQPKRFRVITGGMV